MAIGPPVGGTLFQTYEYGGTPFDATTVAVPSQVPLQLAGVVFTVNNGPDWLFKGMTTFCVQPFEQVRLTLYTPAHKLVNDKDDDPVFQSTLTIPAHPVGFIETLPSHAPQLGAENDGFANIEAG